MEFEGKRILFLGATPASIDLVLQAKKMGAYTVITDWNKDAPAKSYADKAYDISTADIEAVVDMARREGIDGVLAGFDDFNVKIACEVSERLNTNFYCTLYQQEMLSNKKNMKRLCRRFGICTAQEYEIGGNHGGEKIAELTYPVIMKPADSYGSKGIYICENDKDLVKYFENSIGFSKSNTVIVEQYLTGVNVNLFFTVQKGEFSLSAITDKYTRKVDKNLPSQPVCHVFPSKYIDLYYEKLHEKLIEMFRYLNIENGTIDVLTFLCNGEFYIVDIGYRLCGAREYHIISNENEINNLQMYIRHSLTGQFSGWDVLKYDNPYFKNKYCMLTILLKDGEIGEIDGIEEVKKMPYVFNIIQYYKEGDLINAQGRLQQAFARIYLVAESYEELIINIEEVQKTVRVLDSRKENMLLEGFSSDIISKEYIEK